MKGILEFNLDDPDDRAEHEIAVKARSLLNAINSFDQDVLRKTTKYGLSKDVFEVDFYDGSDVRLESLTRREIDLIEQAVGAIRTLLGRHLQENGVDHLE